MNDISNAKRDQNTTHFPTTVHQRASHRIDVPAHQRNDDRDNESVVKNTTQATFDCKANYLPPPTAPALVEDGL